MITAHLPSGYLLARAKGWSGAAMAAAVIGAVWPDTDLFFFFFVDDRAFHHHRYWVHAPAFALAIATTLIALAHWFAPRTKPIAIAFAAGWFIHILLDSIVGDIMWLWPISSELFAIFSVEPTHDHWVLSFIFHWTFLIEVMIWLFAVTLLVRNR